MQVILVFSKFNLNFYEGTLSYVDRYDVHSSAKTIQPTSAMPYYMFYQGRKKIGIPTDLLVLSEQNQSVQKISWVYLGTSFENKKRIHRFEIKGGLSQIIHLDMDGRILKIKDLARLYEISNVQ